MKKTISLLVALCLLTALFCGAAAADDESYRVQVLDINGEPVKGVMVQFCSDTQCMMSKTDASGTAEFAAEAGSYTVHILKAPERCLPDSTEYAAPKTPGLITLVLHTGEEALPQLAAGDVIRFETTDLDGNPVNSADVFSEAKVTMISFWTSRCDPCREELPELAKMADEFAAQGGQIIGVCQDATEEGNPEQAKSILEEAGVPYLNLVCPEGADDFFTTSYFPITYFVDRDGKLLANPVFGAYPDTYRNLFAECTAAAE